MTSQDELFKPRVRIINRGEPRELRKDDPKSVAERLLKRPTVIHIFTDSPDRVFDPEQISSYLSSTLGPNFTAQYHGDFVRFVTGQNQKSRVEFTSDLGRAKLLRSRATFDFVGWAKDEEKIKLEEEAMDKDPVVPFREFFKEQSAKGRMDQVGNRYYEIDALGDVLSKYLPVEFKASSAEQANVTIVFTGRSIGEKFGQTGIHARGGFSFGSIAVVSTSGLVEAPGKPIELERAAELGGVPMFDNPEYNKKIMDALKANGNVLDLDLMSRVVDEIFIDRMLHFEDERLNEAVRGITLSMILSTLGEYGKASQCSTSNLSLGQPDTSKTCRLHDSHWQEELIAAQIKKPGDREFCEYHTELFGLLQRVKTD